MAEKGKSEKSLTSVLSGVFSQPGGFAAQAQPSNQYRHTARS